MAEFKYKSIREMKPRPGHKFATKYYKQSSAEYTRLNKFVSETLELVVTNAELQNCYNELLEPLHGFKRTGGRPNYTPLDIMLDLYTQMQRENDVPEAMIGRWNRFFDCTPFIINLVEDAPPNPLFNRLYYR